jgi:hypothetical protein
VVAVDPFVAVTVAVGSGGEHGWHMLIHGSPCWAPRG